MFCVPGRRAILINYQRGEIFRLTDSSLRRCVADMSEAEVTVEVSPATQCAQSGASDEASAAQRRTDEAPKWGEKCRLGVRRRIGAHYQICFNPSHS